MDNEQREIETIEKLARWTEQQPLIRAMLLESSRANPQASLDIFSDYDILLIVSSLQPFIENDTWIHDLGTPLVRFDDQDQEEGLDTYTRLVLYDDGTKVDYILWPVALLERIRNKPRLPDLLDVGYRVLVDKDDLTRGLKQPTYTAHIPPKPTKEQYIALVEEFWWESTYVAKNIWRGELIEEKYNLDVVMKFELLRKLLEWRIEIDHDWSVRPSGATGKGLKRWLSADTWAQLASTYVGPGRDENWDALFTTIDLFRRTAVEVGDTLGFAYPHDLDRRVTAYLQQIKDLKV